MLKNSDSRFSNCCWVSLSRPVVWSSVAPVAFWYAWNASVAIMTSVVPVSTMPAEPRSSDSLPYARSWSMPQYALAGAVLVIAGVLWLGLVEPKWLGWASAALGLVLLLAPERRR